VLKPGLVRAAKIQSNDLASFRSSRFLAHGDSPSPGASHARARPRRRSEKYGAPETLQKYPKRNDSAILTANQRAFTRRFTVADGWVNARGNVHFTADDRQFHDWPLRKA
jgi:hypothetical protein